MLDKANKRDFNCFPQFRKGCFHLPVLRPDGSAAHDAELPRRRIAWTPALLQPIRYKVIIRIHLSASGRRYI
jgi:hypothetical protein